MDRCELTNLTWPAGRSDLDDLGPTGLARRSGPDDESRADRMALCFVPRCAVRARGAGMMMQTDPLTGKLE